jgi:UDP-glucuronate 4-epimerase
MMAAIEYEATPFEIINLGESQTVTVNRMIELLEEALGRKAVIERRPPQPGDLPLTHADITKARKLLDYQPTTPIETGIKKFAEWFKPGRGVDLVAKDSVLPLGDFCDYRGA